MLYEANISNSKGNSDYCVESCGFSLSNRHFAMGRSLNFSLCDGKAAVVENSYNCVGFPLAGIAESFSG